MTHDPINHPPHYISHPARCSCGSGVECIQITEHMSFLRGNAVKYLWRADHKNGLEDLRKARWYLDREIANYLEQSPPKQDQSPVSEVVNRALRAAGQPAAPPPPAAAPAPDVNERVEIALRTARTAIREGLRSEAMFHIDAALRLLGDAP